jgi:signal recognition particle subunit SRP54
MTPGERQQPEIINGSRRLRISKGSGRSVQEINALLNQFSQMKKMMKKMGKNKHIKMPGLADFGSLN